MLIAVLRVLRYRIDAVGPALRQSGERVAALTYDDPDAPLLVNEARILKQLSIPATVFVSTLKGRRDWHILRALAKNGWEIGTLGHELTHLSEQNHMEQKRLISLAKASVTKQIGRAPQTFAYPYGAYDATTISCLREEGFTAAVTMRPGANPPAGDGEPYHLRRLALTGSLPRDLWAVIRAALSHSPAEVDPVIRSPLNRDPLSSTRRAGATF